MTASLLPLADLALRLGRVDRATLHPDGVRWETDTDHTVMLALITPAVAAEHPELGLDVGLVTQLAVVHDLVEAYAGDTDTFRLVVEGRTTDKAAREAVALERIAVECAAWPWVVRTIRLYEAQQVREARFVRYLDKVCPRLTNTLNRGAAIRARGLGKAASFEHDRRLIDGLAEQYPEFAAVCGALLRRACDESEAAWLEDAP